MSDSTTHTTRPKHLHEIPKRLDDVWQWWRDLMPVSQQWAYFDHSAVAPLSDPAAQTLRRFTDMASTSGDVHWLDWSAKVETLRTLTAELICCESEEVALVPNTTAGINFVANGYPWQDGDNVVLPEGEFPSNRFPWLNLADRGVSVKTVPRRDGRAEVDDLIAAVDEHTKIIAVSWVGYASGFRIELDRLVREAHDRGVLVFLDAIQGLGIYPLDLRSCDVDFLSADGHKWLLGPEGAGVAVIRRRHLNTLRCENVGWASVRNAHLFSGATFDLRDDAGRFETGSANMPGLMAFASSLEMFVEVGRIHGPDAIGERVLERAHRLREMISERGGKLLFDNEPFSKHGSGIVTFEVPGESPADFRSRGLENGVVVSCRGGGVRASVHVYNDDTDLKKLADLIPR
ncbi:aminotransferase class V-fold PLP-dependent enzyme [Rhodopirellula sallentina]|uniref:Class V aminotransferase n=1 Tax=Rhodopirellula sallentina SM41 TaxID=1263870 RepID=M5U1W5_9BACT|nr:aminotransferase class V-fold PLP-dependent enzyme [Rhodopirellula sallentina]EMI55254.1 class V aminotransferase [Rhodopirellula sallentina SM41]